MSSSNGTMLAILFSLLALPVLLVVAFIVLMAIASVVAVVIGVIALIKFVKYDRILKTGINNSRFSFEEIKAKKKSCATCLIICGAIITITLLLGILVVYFRVKYS